jgi:5-hydroxyisourate hydrolase
MSPITTHVLDISGGRPAEGIDATLEVEAAGGWQLVGKGTTDIDGRISDLVSETVYVGAGTYRLIFDTGAYFDSRQVKSFYPQVSVVFRLENPGQHYHVPLLLSPFGYSTYRGS